jgi:hypothetical protein
MPTKYAGSCHCGDVAFEAEGEIPELNRHLISHKFCKRCGIQPFSFATDQKGNKMAAVNARTLEGIDLSGLPKREFNGRAL